MTKKKKKLATPSWRIEGYDSEADYNKAKGLDKKKKSEKTFKVRVCPKCGSDNVGVQLGGEEGKGAKNWECRECKWSGQNVEEKEFTEEEFMKYLDNKGEVVA